MKMKKLLSAILAGAMALGLMSVPAFADDDYVAQVGSKRYTTLQAAVDDENSGYGNNEIKLLKNATGAGVVIDKSVAINFVGYTYTVSDPAVGSDGTKTNGFQLLEGSNPNRKNTVWLKNGTLKVAEESKEKFYILVQNYANLTLVDMNLDATYCDRYTGATLPEGATTSSAKGYSFALSNNSGIVHMVGNTNITANNDGEHSYAFDVCKFGSYKEPMVIVNTNGKITGAIDYSGFGEDTSHLCIEQGEFTVDVEAYLSANSTWSSTEKKATRKTIAMVGNESFDNLTDAVAAGGNRYDKIVKLTADATGEGVVINKGVTIDFNGYTYSVNRGVGSTGSETNGFQLLDGDKSNVNAIIFKNGSIKVADNCEGEFTILLQNYSNLTLENMSLDGNGLDREWKNGSKASYVVSNCSGVNHFVGNTGITANESGEGFAFDVDKKDSTYSLPMVIVDTTGTITGNIEYSKKYGTDKSRLFISQGKFETDVSEFKASTSNWNPDTKTVTRENIAFIGETGYPSLQAAVDAAEEGAIINLTKNITDSGVVIPEGKKLTIDFDGNVYSVNRGVGSTGTETNGFQLRKNSTLTFKSGGIDVAEACASRIAVLVMNYADLTLDDIDIDGGNVMRNAYKSGDDTWVLSVNNGNVKLAGSTTIRTPELPKAYALDVWNAPAYEGKPSVTIDTRDAIYGNIQTYDDKTVLKIEQGVFTFDASDYIDSTTQFIIKGEDVDDEGRVVVLYSVVKKATEAEATFKTETGVKLENTTEGTTQRADVVTITTGTIGFVQYTATKGEQTKTFGTVLNSDGIGGRGQCAFGILLYNIPTGWEISTPNIAVYNMN